MQQLRRCTQSTRQAGWRHQRVAPRPIVRCNAAAAPGTASKTVSDLQKDIISLAGSKYGHDLDASTRAEASRSAGVVLVHATRDQHAHACKTSQTTPSASWEGQQAHTASACQPHRICATPCCLQIEAKVKQLEDLKVPVKVDTKLLTGSQWTTVYTTSTGDRPGLTCSCQVGCNWRPGWR